MNEEVMPELLDERWQKAIDNAVAVLKGRDPKVSDEKLAEEQSAVETAIRDFAAADSLKVIVYSTDDGQEHRSIEPEWSETDGFGLPVDLYAGLMGMDTPHYFEHGDPTSPDFLGAIADASQKPVAARVNEQYIEPVAPREAAAA